MGIYRLTKLLLKTIVMLQLYSGASKCYGGDQHSTNLIREANSSQLINNVHKPLQADVRADLMLSVPKEDRPESNRHSENGDSEKVVHQNSANGSLNSWCGGVGFGVIYFTVDKQVELISIFQEDIWQRSKDPDVYYQLGMAYETQGLNDEAVVAYKQVIRIKPDMYQARLRLAEVRLSQGNEKGALIEYAEFLKLKPASPDIQLRMARIFARSNEVGLAIEMYRSVLGMAPQDINANREIAMLYKSKKEYDKAAEHFRKVIDLNKDDKESRNALVAIYGSNKQFAILIDLLKETGTLSPEDFNNHYRLAMTYDYLKDYVHAMESYNKVLTLKPDHLKSLNALRNIYSKTGRSEEARHLQKSIKAFDRDRLFAFESQAINSDDFDPEPHKINYSLKTHTPKKTKIVPKGVKKKHHHKQQKPDIKTKTEHKQAG